MPRGRTASVACGPGRPPAIARAPRGPPTHRTPCPPRARTAPRRSARPAPMTAGARAVPSAAARCRARSAAGRMAAGPGAAADRGHREPRAAPAAPADRARRAGRTALRGRGGTSRAAARPRGGLRGGLPRGTGPGHHLARSQPVRRYHGAALNSRPPRGGHGRAAAPGRAAAGRRQLAGMAATVAANGRVVRGRRLGWRAPEGQCHRGRVHVLPGRGLSLGALAPGGPGQGRHAGLAAAAIAAAPVTAAALGPPGIGGIKVRAVVVRAHPGG